MKNLMSKLLSARYTSGAVNLSLLLIRLGFGGLLMTHGWPKLVGFSEYAAKFPDPIGLGSQVALGLTVFAEFFCSALVVIGLATRLASIPVVICMSVVVFVIHGADPLAKQEMGLMYLVAFLAILISGPGRYSIDGLLKK
jgi:putative oxidoreductase